MKYFCEQADRTADAEVAGQRRPQVRLPARRGRDLRPAGDDHLRHHREGVDVPAFADINTALQDQLELAFHGQSSAAPSRTSREGEPRYRSASTAADRGPRPATPPPAAWRSDQAAPQRRRGPARRRRPVRALPGATGAMFLLPNLVLVAVFLLVPLVLAFVISFEKLESLGPGEYLGINNYPDLLRDPCSGRAAEHRRVHRVHGPGRRWPRAGHSPSCSTGVLPGPHAVPVDHLPAAGDLGRRDRRARAWMFDENNGSSTSCSATSASPGRDWQSSGLLGDGVGHPRDALAARRLRHDHLSGRAAGRRRPRCSRRPRSTVPAAGSGSAASLSRCWGRPRSSC